MPRYKPVTEVMPLTSMVTGAVVGSALCDQMRDNLVALYDGWWFRAQKSTNTTAAVATVTPFVLDTISMSQTAEDEGSISLVAGSVTVTRTGIWVVGGHYTMSTADVVLVAVEATDSPANFVFESVSDSTSVKTDISGSGVVEVTSNPATFTLVYYMGTGGTITANSRSAFMWGYWAADLP